jgi:hypothetical protein
MSKTPYKIKCEILAEVWMDYREDVNFEDLFKYGDLAFPLAYSITNGIVKNTKKAESFVVEVFDLMIASFGIEDTGFEDLDDIFLAGDIEGLDDGDE